MSTCSSLSAWSCWLASTRLTTSSLQSLSVWCSPLLVCTYANCTSTTSLWTPPTHSPTIITTSRNWNSPTSTSTSSYTCTPSSDSSPPSSSYSLQRGSCAGRSILLINTKIHVWRNYSIPSMSSTKSAPSASLSSTKERDRICWKLLYAVTSSMKNVFASGCGTTQNAQWTVGTSLISPTLRRNDY